MCLVEHQAPPPSLMEPTVAVTRAHKERCRRFRAPRVPLVDVNVAEADNRCPSLVSCFKSNRIVLWGKKRGLMHTVLR